MQRVYNLMADMIRCILDEEKEGNQNVEVFSVSSSTLLDLFYKDVKENVPSLFDDGHIIRLSGGFQVDNVISEAIELYKKCKSKRVIGEMIYLLKCLDESLMQEFKFMRKKIFDSLNSNHEETNIILLPYMRCDWQRSSRGHQHGYTLFHYLKNVYYVQKERMNHLELKNVILPLDIFHRMNEKHCITIGCCPITEKVTVKNVESFEEEGFKYFEVKDLCNKDMIKENVLKLLEKARENEVDILVFPEMLGTKEVNDSVLNLLKENISYFEYSPLIILPSLWEKGHNNADIIIDEGDLTITQSKQNPVTLFSYGREYIKPDGILYVIHIPRIGRICVAICADFLNNEYLDILLKELKVSLLIVPSFSTGVYDFDNTVESCKKYDCSVIWLNSCSAIHLTEKDKFDMVSIILKSGRNSGVKEVFPQNCNHMCDTCMFITTIDTNITV